MKKHLAVITAIIIGSCFMIPEAFSVNAETYDGEKTKVETYVENEVIVVMEDGEFDNAKDRAVEAVLAEEGKTAAETVDVSTVSREENAVIVQSGKDIDEENLCNKLKGMKGVEYAQPNYIYETDSSSGTNDTYSAGMWNLDYIDAKEAWDLIDSLEKNWNQEEHQKVKVAALDTGTNMNHPDLTGTETGGNLDKDNCVEIKATPGVKQADGKEYTHNTYWGRTSGGHGSTTAGLIGATANNGTGIAGVAAGNNNDIIELMAIDVFSGNDSKQYMATTVDIVAGIDYAVEKGAKIIMMCLGHTRNASGHNDALLEEKVNWAVYGNDVVITASAGNHRNTAEWLPSDFEACISCINTKKYSDIDSSDCKNKNSSFGPKKDISAPGTDITHIGSGSTYSTGGSGTSYSSPTVAAVAALVRYVRPDINQQQVKNILYSTTIDLYKKGKDDYTGYGNVNAYNAVSKACGKNDRLSVKKLPLPSATVRSNSDSSIKISWKSVDGASKYYIYRSDSYAGNFKLVKSVSKSSKSWTNTGRTFNKKYYYKIQVRGTSDDGKRIDSPISGAYSAAARCGVPKISVKAKSKKTAKVSWSKAADASGYKIYRAKSLNGKYKCIKTVKKGKKGSITVSKLKSKKTYYYKVKAYKIKNGKKYYSNYSDIVSCKQK